MSIYPDKKLFKALRMKSRYYPVLIPTFTDWLLKYSDVNIDLRDKRKFNNKIIYHIDNETDYVRAILDFISGMSDHYAVKCFNDVMKF
jgi:dGTPase